MPYCTLSDIEKHLQTSDIVQLTNDAGGATIDQAVVDEAILAAGDLIDGYVGGLYALPFDSPPGILQRLAVTLAIWELYNRRTFLTVSPELKKRRDEALETLELIRNGKLKLGLPAPGNAGRKMVLVSKSDEDRVFPSSLLDRM